MPEIREYDILAIRNAGAYCYSMGSVYNLRSMPGEIVISKGNVVSFKKRKSDAELVDSILEDCQL
jgi:diaminopimelate decarboxylase